MEDFKSILVFVTYNRCSGLDLSATHRVFPAVAWEIFSVHIFFCCSLNVVVNDSVSANHFFKFLVRLKYIIGSPSNVLDLILCLFSKWTSAFS